MLKGKSVEKEAGRMGEVEGTGERIEVALGVRSPGGEVSWDGRQVGWTSEWEEGRFLGTSFSEKEKLKSSAESWEEQGRRL